MLAMERGATLEPMESRDVYDCESDDDDALGGES